MKEARKSGVTVFGTGTFAQSVVRGLRSVGIKTDAMVVTTPRIDSHQGIPVVALRSLDQRLKELPMCLGAFNREPGSDYAALAAECTAAGVHRVLTPPQFFDTIASAMGWHYWLTELRNYDQSQEMLDAAVDGLADETSRQQLVATIAFRRSGLPQDLPRPDASPQYFPDFMTNRLRRPLTYVDGGAYDGDTVREAGRRIKPDQAIAFEPDLANYTKLTAALGAASFPVICLPCGLSNTTGLMCAAIGNGDASFIDAEGQGKVQVIRLDDCYPGGTIDYLKLDIEGHELAALAGSIRILQRCRPRLAIAAYHRWDDLWRIPGFLRQLKLDYKISYRIHAHNTFESVFYAY